MAYQSVKRLEAGRYLVWGPDGITKYLVEDVSHDAGRPQWNISAPDRRGRWFVCDAANTFGGAKAMIKAMGKGAGS